MDKIGPSSHKILSTLKEENGKMKKKKKNFRTTKVYKRTRNTFKASLDI